MSNNRIDALERAPIKGLLWRYALPAIIGSSVNALYNIIGRYFVGNTPYLGDAAMTAMGVALPIMIIIAAFGMLVGAGSASRISIFLGQGSSQKAEKVLGTALLLTLGLTLTVSLLLFAFLDPVVRMLGAKGEMAYYTKAFLSFFLPGSIFSTLCFSFNNMMRASGYPRKAMYIMIFTLVVNIILAPLFLRQFEWGIEGAAIATVISMIVGTILVLYHFTVQSRTLRLRLRYIRIDKEIAKAILSIGMSPFLMQLVSSTVVFIIIRQLDIYGGEAAVGAYTIMNALLMLMIMIMVGLTQGMQPIVGYSYGAAKYERVEEALKYTIKIGMTMGLVGLIISLFFPHVVVNLFKPSDHAIIDETIRSMRISGILLPIVGFQIVATSFFQSIGKVAQSIVLSVSRQLLFLLPALFTLPRYFGTVGVWASIPVADFSASIITAILLIVQIRAFRAARKMQDVKLKAKSDQ
ncbi:MATE family efflux transporter [Ignatzschineria sp. RMDPL8A]|uniref:MATE family efflux transporter n=1 Tax=Ignatzschineria sp. RMDPL8A TaxID=2999236 RepID=UPI0016B2F193|nr:MATE family efflux transporter [Ignatzschineria sp. RMDPL8A]MDG9730581.1 MATE family efflux transporter [Ignatzschineria sp. RMDPL8A]NLD08651.1 MATE family efflux transporter [Xanthomonadaceae bacterium]